MELGWTVLELAAAQQAGRPPIDTQKYAGMQLKWNMDTDEQVYIGDKTLGANGVAGLVNQSGINTVTAAKRWAGGSPDDIRNSINDLLNAAWKASAYSVVPTDLLLPPEQYAYLASVIVSSAGNQSLLTYLTTNTHCLPPERCTTQYPCGEMAERGGGEKHRSRRGLHQRYEVCPFPDGAVAEYSYPVPWAVADCDLLRQTGCSGAGLSQNPCLPWTVFDRQPLPGLLMMAYEQK